MKDQLDNFLTKGYARFNELGLLNLSKFVMTNVEVQDKLVEDKDPEQQLELKNFIDYITKNYVNPIWPNAEVTYYGVWDGVDEGSMTWHNDAVEGFDFNVLYYYDSTDEDVGGAVEFRYNGGEDIIYPKAGDIVFINQNGKFYHKANRSEKQRRVATIEYKTNSNKENNERKT